MPDEPASRFLDVTEAAERMYQALSELKNETAYYSEATSRLDAASEKSQALCDATSRVIEEQMHRWEELKQILDGTVAPALGRLSENADKQTVHLSSLSAAVAGQQSQLVQLQQSSDAVVKLGEQQRAQVTSLVEAANAHGKTLREQTDTLQEHGDQLTGIRDDLHDQRIVIRDLSRMVKRSVYAAAAAAVFALVAVVLVFLV